MLKLNRRNIIILVIILGLIGLLVFYKKKKTNGEAYVVSEKDLSDVLLLAGTVDAKNRVDLAFANPGRVKKVHSQVGDFVKKGDLIAEIEQNTLASNLSRARAQYSLVKADTQSDLNATKLILDKQIQEQDAIVEGLYRDLLSTDLEALNLDEKPGGEKAPVISGTYVGEKEGSYFLELYSSNSDSGYSYRLSGLEEGTFTAEVNQPAKLGTQGLYIQFDPNTRYRNTEWEVKVPNKRSISYSARKRAYDTALSTRARVISGAENSHQRNLGSAGINKQKALQNQAVAEINAVNAQIESGKIRAPFDGYIVKNELTEGESVNAYVPYVVMFEDDRKILSVNTPEIYINKLSQGIDAEVEFDAYPGEYFDAYVEFIDLIDTEVNGVPVYETDIEILNPTEKIRSGMNAKAKITSSKKDAVIAIPFHYVESNAQGDFVQKLLPTPRSTYEKQKVSLGYKGNDGFVEILEGLSVGDKIVLNSEE